MVEAILQPLVQWVTGTIGVYGLLAVFLLMILESTGIPIPSEAISPFAGYLVFAGKMSFFWAVTAGVAGNMVGSWIAYAIGATGGRGLWLRYGRFVGVRAHHLATAEKWFEHYGEIVVFVGRILPVVRTFISFPAGAAKMNLFRFSAYTLLGCIPWVTALTYFGYFLGRNWERVGSYLHYLDYLVVLGVVLAVAYLLWRRFSARTPKA